MNPYVSLIAQYRQSQTEYETCFPSGAHHVAIRAVFDHYWEQHLLVQQCSTGPAAAMLGMDGWEYALYYCGAGEAIHICTFFDVERTPFAEAASMVECWAASGHYGGRSNSVESDVFG